MKRALISVFDKEGIVKFSKKLVELGWEIISTGGTYKLLTDSGIECMRIEEVTEFPEVLDGRVKTLNPRIHSGILFKRNDENHRKTMEDLELQSIDMVVNNLYPFEETLAKSGVTDEEIIENIDIGGPSMIRAAAKNFEDVLVVVDPADYSEIINRLENDNISFEFKRNLARKVFNYTAYYDSLIADYFNEKESVMFPEYLTLGYRFKDEMRYGENPHQKAAFYVDRKQKGTLAAAKQLNGKALSFNNINDTNGALTILKEFEMPTAVAVKHSNPCGIGSGKNVHEAYLKAFECDPVSIFGGIVAINDTVDKDVAEELHKIFLEVVIAPSFTEEALEILTKKSNLRLLELEDISYIDPKAMNLKKVDGGLLIQEKDQILFDKELEVISDRKPTEEDIEQLTFAWKAIKNGNSNGVCLTKDYATIGIGLGEVNRVWAVENAVERAGDKAKDAYLASDGFFPFKDSIEVLAKAGVKAIIQPGGSIRDDEVIECVNENDMIMIFTGMRHFKH